MSNRKKPAKSLATSRSSNVAVHLVRTGIRTNSAELRYEVYRRTVGLNEDELRRLVGQLAWQASTFANRVPEAERSEMLWEFDNAHQLVGQALREQIGAAP